MKATKKMKNKMFRVSASWYGAREFTSRVKNGDVIIFEPNNIVTDNDGDKGLYNLSGDKSSHQYT